ncbi:hypothetical protein D3C72_1684600 [compost metagenome]
MQLRKTGAGIAFVVQPPMVFVTLEVAQGFIPAPPGVAGQLGPMVVIARLAAHVDHAVDAGAAAQGLAARVEQAAAVEAGLGLGLVEPVGARVANAVQIAHGDVDPVVIVAPARFDQQHAVARIGREAVAQQRACRACADHDIVEGSVVSGCRHAFGGLVTRAANAAHIW